MYSTYIISSNLILKGDYRKLALGEIIYRDENTTGSPGQPIFIAKAIAASEQYLSK